MKVTVEYLPGGDGTAAPAEIYDNVAAIGLVPGFVQLQGKNDKPIAMIAAVAVRRIFAPENDTTLELA